MAGDSRILSASSFDGIDDDVSQQSLDDRELLLTLREIKVELSEIRRGVTLIANIINSVVFETTQNPPTVGITAEFPEEFPGYAALVNAGITKISEIPRTSKSLRSIDGIRDDEIVPILRSLSPKEI